MVRRHDANGGDDAAADMPVPRKLWVHPAPRETGMWRFMQGVNARRGLKLESFHDLHTWSVSDDGGRLAFYEDLWHHCANLIHTGQPQNPIVDPTARFDSIPAWFQGVRLNFAENVLYTRDPASPSTRSTAGKEDAKTAVTAVREGGSAAETETLTWAQLRAKVRALAHAMRARGLRKGDRVAVVASHSADTLVCFLAATAVGALFSSSSTDMGAKGVLDRLTQVRPRWVFVDDWAVYNGKRVDLGGKIREIVAGLKEVEEFEGVVVQGRFAEEKVDVSGLERAVALDGFLDVGGEVGELVFERVEFGDPFLVVYSSGTTGVPKCIVHSVGGVLLNAMKEGKLHKDLGPDIVGLQYTTTGWIMYLTSVLTLLPGGHAVLYDGSPFHPTPHTLLALIPRLRITHLGLSPRYFQTLQSASLAPRDLYDCSSLRAVTSTGMVLPDALFNWFYDTAFPPHVHLDNIAGGTDIAGCFGIGNPLVPVHVGGCQGAALGVRVEIFDSTLEGGRGVAGKPVPDGVPGELVATRPFPNVPVRFWGDEGGEKYWKAYFERFDDVWTHGDFVLRHPRTGGLVFLGRADGVLNPSGVRFGSAEVYAVIEGFFRDKVADSICVGQRRPGDADESVMLFLLMKEGVKFNEGLVREVKERIGKELSKRHVPKWVFETKEIPTTVNLKKVELPVKQIVSGQVIKPSGTLLNPESLKYYYQFAEVEKLVEKQGFIVQQY
ncbi:acetoacetate-CoA ligase [Neofusicoccum parvum]|nr:acetoacetate-CoA ligase [Neofusicoccum parvum]